jgi:hypothetical protein
LGIVRYPVECPGCQAAILLRLGVGHESRQRFYYVCPTCKAATKGALLWHGNVTTELELDEGRKLLDETSCGTVLNINPELPSYAAAKSMEEHGGSPFITFFEWLGSEGIQRYQRSFYQTKHLMDTDWLKLKRLTTYYINRDWQHFDQAITELLPDELLTFTAEWYRDDRLHKLYELFFAEMWSAHPLHYFLDLKSSWNRLWAPQRGHFDDLVSFARFETATPAFENIQRDVFSQLARFVDLVWAMFPGLLLDLVPSEHEPRIDELRLFRDEFEVLRDFYIQAFETSHKMLRWIIGSTNIDKHGDANMFVPITGMPSHVAKRVPKNLDAFGKLTSANKSEWLVLFPEWHKHWDAILDRHLRNDIGHASARHDLSTGTIQRDGRSPLPYTRFVQRLHRVLHILLANANALKIMRIYAHA